MNILKNSVLFWIAYMTLMCPLIGQRVPVLDQIDLPHNYYFRELYLPQLTSGPSSADWTPDGKSLIYSMAGSLWLHNLQSATNTQLTDGKGYDYQPDYGPDGKHVAFARYNGTSIELMLLNLETKITTKLTQNGAVNIEPSWSPDGKTLAFVSTLETNHFLLYTAQFSGQALKNMSSITPDRQSDTKRYYYSAFDHAINPTWSPDGNELYFISNREVAHGTGDIVSLSYGEHLSQNGMGDVAANITTIHHEETSWKTSPDLSPDGTRMVYSSYLGRNWHQLWLLPANGGYPVPLTYGAYDNTEPKWSPDGEQIAFISNRTGNTSLWLVDAFSGRETQLDLSDRTYLKSHRPIRIQVRDELGKPTSARISITDSSGKFYSPEDVLIAADDSRYPEVSLFEQHYFHINGACQLMIPQDSIQLTVSNGPEYEIYKTTIDGRGDPIGPVTVDLKRLTNPEFVQNWWSGDLHVHMNYGGTYQVTPPILKQQARAEDLDFVYNLIVNKEQRIPDINYFSSDPDTSSTDVLLMHAQEFHTSYWGHLGVLNLEDHFIVPDYSGYPKTAFSSLFPHNPYVARVAREQNALVGYVHPFLGVQLYPEQSETLTNDLPVNAALGLVDYYELIGFADHIPSADVWYKLLNCGLRIPVGAGTDAMANYASLRGPVGVNRVYIKADGDLSANKIKAGIKQGNGFVTNGPLIDFNVEEQGPGEVISMETGKRRFTYQASLKSAVPVDYLELVWNGQIVAQYALTELENKVEVTGQVEIEGPGWLLARAWSKKAHPDLFDSYPYASTNPIYFERGDQKIRSASSADYFIKWIDRLIENSNDQDLYRNEEELEKVMNDLNAAKQFYEGCRQQATID